MRLILSTPQGRVSVRLYGPWRLSPYQAGMTLGDAVTRWLDQRRAEQEWLLAHRAPRPPEEDR